MSLRLQLDGDDLESLLGRVHEEYGSRARIIGADKVRSGGLGGFFTREHYAMTIEVDEEGVAMTPTPVVEAVPVPTVDDMPDTPSALLGLAEATSEREVSTTTTTFADVLHRIAAAAGPAEDMTATSSPAAVLAPADVAREPDFEPYLPALPAAARLTTQDVGAADVTCEHAPETTDAAAVCEPVLDERSRRLLALGLPLQFLPRPDEPDTHAAITARLADRPTAAEPDLAPGSIVVLVGAVAAGLQVGEMLTRGWGLPASAVVLADGGTSSGLGPERQRIAGPDVLATRAANARRRGVPLVLVVPDDIATAPATRTTRSCGWPDGVLEAVRSLDGAATTWALASATRKPADVERWATGLGGVDALVLVDVEITTDPATVLETSLPVARLGDRSATSAAWASLLCERLVAAG